MTGSQEKYKNEWQHKRPHLNKLWTPHGWRREIHNPGITYRRSDTRDRIMGIIGVVIIITCIVIIGFHR